MEIIINPRFESKGLSYAEHQFNQIYLSRLEQIKPRIDLPPPVASKINEIIDNQLCSIAVLIFKELATRTNILDDYRELGGDSSHDPPLERSPEDKIYGEDASGRIQLLGIDPDQFETGTVIGFTGTLNHTNFTVTDIIFPSPLPLYVPPIGADPPIGTVALISNLEINSFELGYYHNTLSQMLKKCDAAVFLGNNFEIKTHEKEGETLSFQTRMQLIEQLPVNKLNSFISVVGIPIIVLPGVNDPVSLRLPQQSYHPYLLSTKNALLTTNPAEFTLNGVNFVATAGDQIIDMMRTTNLINEDNENSAAEYLLRWHHLAPNAPDHIPCIPLPEDKMVLEYAPQVFVYGQALEFQFSHFQNETNIIGVPSFKDTHSFVVYDLDNQTAQLVECTAASNDDEDE